MELALDWVRHGQGVANLTHTFSCRHDDAGLTDRGRAQADALGRTWAAQQRPAPDLVVSSPLNRTRQTAQIVAGHLSVPYGGEVEGFRELDVGELDGRSDEASWAVFDQVFGRFMAGEPDARFPGGESLAELVTRVRAAVASVVAACPGSSVLVVAHGGNLLAALPWLTGQPHGRTDFGNCETARLEVGTDPPGEKVTLLGFEPPPPVTI